VETASDGNNYLALLPGADDVRSLEPDLAAIAHLDRTGVVMTAAGDDTHDFVSRYFAPAKGIPEDPVTGGAHCARVPFWAARTGKDTFFAYQASRRGGELAGGSSATGCSCTARARSTSRATSSSEAPRAVRSSAHRLHVR
jgi:predicted PhzF superfamily epimerase YddE/YHI9